jgi:hypothetical protein
MIITDKYNQSDSYPEPEAEFDNKKWRHVEEV